MNDEDDASESERAEAEALARALDGEAEAQPPADALQAAMFLRHGGARGELAPERSEAILQDLLRAAPVMAQPKKRSRVARLWPIGAALAAAAVLLLVLTPSEKDKLYRAPDPAAKLHLPEASTSLLAAQADLLRQTGAAGAKDPAVEQRFDRELRAYRAQVLRALEAAYPAPVGMLEPQRRAR